jgi:hypothetical protein
MSTYKLKELTETSYILDKDGSYTGLVTITTEGFKVIGPFDRKVFSDAAELTSYLGGDLSIEPRESEDDKEDEIGQINGYPIKHKAVFDVEEGDIVTYSKTSKGKARFAAGYYALDFEHGWTGSYCPRTQTLDENQFIGPFRTKLEMQNAMAQKKRVSKI